MAIATVRLYRPKKIAALIAAGHTPSSLFRLDRQLCVYFDDTPEFRATLIAYEALERALKAMERGEIVPCASNLATAVAKARQQYNERLVQ